MSGKTTIILSLGIVLAAGATFGDDLDIEPFAPGLFRGAAPTKRADYDLLQRYGIRTVVDQRKFKPFASNRERRELESRGIAYYKVPMGFFPRRDCTVEQSLALITNPGNYPLFAHCNLGVDRTSLSVGVFRVRYQGWSHEAAYREMMAHQFHPIIIGLPRYFWLGGRPSAPARRRNCR